MQYLLDTHAFFGMVQRRIAIAPIKYRDYGELLCKKYIYCTI